MPITILAFSNHSTIYAELIRTNSGDKVSLYLFVHLRNVKLQVLLGTWCVWSGQQHSSRPTKTFSEFAPSPEMMQLEALP